MTRKEKELNELANRWLTGFHSPWNLQTDSIMGEVSRMICHAQRQEDARVILRILSRSRK